jgi:hypothetical protein
MSTRRGLTVAASLLTAACYRTDPPPRTDLQIAEGWLQCIDCLGSYLPRLHQLPAARRDSIVRFFASALLDGPDSARRARIDRDLLRIWRADSAYAARHGDSLAFGGKQFVQRYRRPIEVILRTRAATALGVLRTPQGLQALDSALKLPLESIKFPDSSLRRAVERARANRGPP